MPRERDDARKPQGRSSRVILGGTQRQLAAEGREGFHRHWFNDKDDRITQAQAAGYSFVMAENHEGADRVEDRRARRVGTHPDGKPMMAYLMEKPQEWYDEDGRVKARPLDEFEATIKRGDTSGVGSPVDRSAFYNKDSSIQRG